MHRGATLQAGSDTKHFLTQMFIVTQTPRWSCHVIICLDRAGMSVFTAMVGIRLSYRDHGRHGNQGWCMVLSRPLHILKHWELVRKCSSLKNKDGTRSIFTTDSQKTTRFISALPLAVLFVEQFVKFVYQ